MNRAFFTLSLFLLLSYLSLATTFSSYASAVYVKGSPLLKSENIAVVKGVKQGDNFYLGEYISTEKNEMVSFLLPNTSVIVLGEKTKVYSKSTYKVNTPIQLFLEKGTLFIAVKSSKKTHSEAIIQTPNDIFIIKNGAAYINAGDDGSTMLCVEETAIISNTNGSSNIGRFLKGSTFFGDKPEAEQINEEEANKIRYFLTVKGVPQILNTTDILNALKAPYPLPRSAASLEAERVAAERARLEAERLERERLAAEKARLESERARLEAERLERERLEAEKAKQEEKLRKMKEMSEQIEEKKTETENYHKLSLKAFMDGDYEKAEEYAKKAQQSLQETEKIKEDYEKEFGEKLASPENNESVIEEEKQESTTAESVSG